MSMLGTCSCSKTNSRSSALFPSEKAPAQDVDPLSVTASVIACYGLASEVAVHCLRYIIGVRHADTACDLVISQIDIFKDSLHHLREILRDEQRNTKYGSAMMLLENKVKGCSASLKVCEDKLRSLSVRLDQAKFGTAVTKAIHRFSWPFKSEEIRLALLPLKNFTDAVQ